MLALTVSVMTMNIYYCSVKGVILPPIPTALDCSLYRMAPGIVSDVKRGKNMVSYQAHHFGAHARTDAHSFGGARYDLALSKGPIVDTLLTAAQNGTLTFLWQLTSNVIVPCAPVCYHRRSGELELRAHSRILVS